MHTDFTHGSRAMTPALIGRDHPAAILRAEIARAHDSHGGLVLITGEAGIGKTTLVTSAMAQARQLGTLVVGGSCWDSDSAPGFWPWTQVVRGLRRGATAQEWKEAQASAGEGLAVLLGEATSTEGADSFQLYDAVTTAVVSVSQSRPLMVVLDDLHWADAASLKLLEFATQHTWFERVLLVGTYRDVEVESAQHPLRALVMPLVAKATTVTLTGLDRAEVAALMERTAGSTPEPALVDEVHRRTGGNPFFVEQTARLWHSGGSITAVAPGVRDAVTRRLSLLPAPVVELLTTAAVLGGQFHRQVLAAAAAAPVAQVERLLDQAVTTRLVGGLGGGRFSFAHDLVRETLYDSVDEAGQQARHAAVVHAIDQSPTLAKHVFPADLARHAWLAGPELDNARAVDQLLAAAADAGARLATEEAIGHYRRALQRVEEPLRRARITLDLGRELFHAGERGEAWNHFHAATALARDLDDPDLLARVALTVYRCGLEGDDQTQLRHELLRTAHRKLVGAASGAGEASIDRIAHDLIVRTEVVARGGDNDEALTFSLWARHDTIWGPGSARERETLTAEMEAVGRRSADHDTEAFAASLRWVALLELGEPRYLDQLRSFVAMAERGGTPRLRMSSMVDRTIIATAAGRFDEADALLAELGTLGDHGHMGWAFMSHHLRWALLLTQGRFAEIDKLLGAMADADHPYLGLLEAVTAVEKGDIDAALRHLASVESAGQPYPRSVTPMWLRLQAQAAAAGPDPALRERVHGALTPYRGNWAVSLWGCDISGPVDLWIAVVDAAQERWDDAIAGFRSAHASADRLQSPPWSITARAGLAEALTGRNGAGDTDAAERLLVEVERDAGEIGMPQIIDRVRRLRARTGIVGPTSVAPPQVSPGPQAYEFRREGATWCLTFAGRTVHMPDAKGLRDLHLLLSRPGTDIPTVTLVDPEGGAVIVAARRMGGDPVLDDEAKAQYKYRLGQLDTEIDRAAERDDDQRRETLERERQALLDELRTAAGLAGRSRRLGDEAERARKTVTARIRDTLRKLDERHPALTAHLRDTISTGATCRYQPNAPIPWRL